MNSIELKQLNKQLDKLSNFFSPSKNISEKEIITWVSNCVSFFSKIGVSDVIISDFIKYYKPRNEGENNVWAKKIIGNFESGGVYARNFYTMTANSYSSEIAFVSAKGILDRKTDENRLVPEWLIKSIDDKKYSGIKSSLLLIENGYQNKDSDSIIKNSLTLLECIMDLDVTLSQKKNLSHKLSELLSNEILRKNFGISKEFIVSLDNGRLIRNIKSVHKKKNINYNIPFLVAINNAYLVILLLEITFATGSLID